MDRDEIFETQTPQISDLETLLRAVDNLKVVPRDEAELLNSINEEIFVYECSPKNFKITTDEDFSDTFRKKREVSRVYWHLPHT